MDTFNPQALTELTQINLQDALAGFGWDNIRFGRKLLEWPFRKSAEKFARMVLEYDRDVAAFGLQHGSHQFLQRFSIQLQIEGLANVPADGPLLVLSNHPGMTDTLALFASLPRQDLRIVAAERPFLQAMKSVESHLIDVPEQSDARLGVMRAVAAHLRASGTILTFPAGQIEPDPAVSPGAVDSLSNWSISTGVFVRLMPGAHIVPTMVSGVLAPQATFHPLTYLRRQPKDRQRVGAVLQLIAMVLKPDLWPVTVKVHFCPAIPAAELAGLHDPALITHHLIECIRPFWVEASRPIHSPIG